MSKNIHETIFTADDSNFRNKTGKVKKRGEWLSKSLKKAGGMIAGAFAFGAIAKGIKDVIKANAEFEHSLAGLSSITGAVGEDLKFYGEAAREVGRTTTIGAVEAVEAIKLMGSARPELLKNKEALAAVTREALVLAEASGLELTAAINSVSSAMNQFNISASESARLINAIAAGSLEGSAEVEDLTASMKNVGTVAAGSNMSLEQTIAALELLGEKQLKGAEAGTKLRGALLKMKAAGVGYASGQFNFADAVAETNIRLAEQTTAFEKDALKAKVFGVENITAGEILLQNSKRYDELTIAVTGTSTAYDQQAVMLNTVSAQWKIFKGTLKDNTIGSEKFTTALSNSLKAATEFLQGLQQVSDSDNLKWWEKLAIKFNTIIPGGIKFTMEESDALTRSGKYAIKTTEGMFWATTDLTTALDDEGATLKELLGIREDLTDGLDDEDDKTKKLLPTIGSYIEKIEKLKEKYLSVSEADKERIKQIGDEIQGYEDAIAAIIQYEKALDSIAGKTGIDISVDPVDVDTTQLKPMTMQAEVEVVEDDDLDATWTDYAAAAGNAFGTVADLYEASKQKELSAAGDNAQKRMAIEKDYLRKQKTLSIAQALINGAVGVTKAFGQGGVLGFITGGLVAAATAAQVAIINAQSFAAGGAVSGPTLSLIGEASGVSRSNPEYVGTAQQLSQMGVGGGGKTLTARISRGDLLFILNEGEKHNKRTY